MSSPADDAAGATGAADHAFVTYNILSEKLCDAGCFSRYPAEHVDQEYRWTRIEAKLRAAMADEAVIMLQENSLEWTSRIAVICAELGYLPLSRCSGGTFSGYMGVALLVPTHKYDVIRVRMARVGDEINAAIPSRASPAASADPDSTTSIVAGAIDAVGRAAHWLLPPLASVPISWVWASAKKSLLGIAPRAKSRFDVPRGDPWREARTRHNSVIYACLAAKGAPGSKPVGVAVYHMPCRFRGKARGVMTLHTWALARLLDRWCLEDGAVPVLGGDFNYTPADRQYGLLATGRLLTDAEEAAAGAADAPKHVDDDPRGSDGGKHGPADPSDFDGRLPPTLRLTSAYKAAHGSEPAATNFNYADMVGEEPFMGTLDFVWVGDGGEVTGAPALPGRSPDGGFLDGPFPSPTEPSDHIAVRVHVRT